MIRPLAAMYAVSILFLLAMYGLLLAQLPIFRFYPVLLPY
jgi:hypothetical protein